MKLMLSAAVAAALFAGLFLVPISGRTLWQRAEARGLPQSAARAMSNGAHAAVRWAEEKRAHGGAPQGTTPRRLPHKDVARAADPATHPNDQPARAQPPAHTLFEEAHYRNGPLSDEHAAPAQPPLGHDHIVAAPAKEHLSDGDRQGLDKLIAGSRSQR